MDVEALITGVTTAISSGVSDGAPLVLAIVGGLMALGVAVGLARRFIPGA